MSVLQIKDLKAGIAGKEILRGIDLEIKSGEVHAVMGPNGAGKSTLGKVLLGHADFPVISGSVTLDGVDLLSLPTWQRAQAGLFFAPQDPVEIPGVSLRDVVAQHDRAASLVGASHRSAPGLLDTEAKSVGVDIDLLERGLNVDCSGGEKKRIETLQLAMFQARIAVLDEIDSGLDIDGLRDVATRIEQLTQLAANGDSEHALGVLAVTHYQRLLEVLRPDFIHILVDGKIVKSGGPEIALELEESGYAPYETKRESSALDDLFRL